MSFNKYRLKGAYHYDWYETEDWYRWAVDRCVDFCKGSTIDIGCGDGLLTSKLRAKGLDVTGVDPDVYGISIALDMNPEIEYWNNSIEDLTDELTGDITHEYLTCLNVIEHLDKPELLKDLIRQDITKGAIIITIDWQGGAFGEDHKHEYTMDELVDFFKEFNPKSFRYKDTEWIGVEIRK